MDERHKHNDYLEYTDPCSYFQAFLASPEVQVCINERYERAHAQDSTITIEDAQRAFLNTSEAEECIWEFYRRQAIFVLDIAFLTPEFLEKLEEYFNQIRLNQEKKHQGNYSQADDLMRSAKHTAAAQQLVLEGSVPSFSLARIMVHFMAVSIGLDVPDPGRSARRRRGNQ